MKTIRSLLTIIAVLLIARAVSAGPSTWTTTPPGAGGGGVDGGVTGSGTPGTLAEFGPTATTIRDSPLVHSGSALVPSVPIDFPDGVLATPSIGFSGETNSGFYRSGAGIISAAVAATRVFDFKAASIVSQKPFFVPAGVLATPSLTVGTGAAFYQTGSNILDLETNGVNRLIVDTAAITSTLPYVAPLGAVTTPSFTFTGDLNNGWWSPGADIQAWSVAGAEAMRLASTGNFTIGSTTSTSLFNVGSTIAANFQINGSGHIGLGEAPNASFVGLLERDAADTLTRFYVENASTVGASMIITDTHATGGVTLGMASCGTDTSLQCVNNANNGVLFTDGNTVGAMAFNNYGNSIPFIWQINNAEVMRMSTAGALTPGADNTGSIGTAGLRWSLIRGVVITSGHLGFDDEFCVVCGLPFEPEDDIVMHAVSRVVPDDGKPYIATVPIHAECRSHR